MSTSIFSKSVDKAKQTKTFYPHYITSKGGQSHILTFIERGCELIQVKCPSFLYSHIRQGYEVSLLFIDHVSVSVTLCLFIDNDCLSEGNRVTTRPE